MIRYTDRTHHDGGVRTAALSLAWEAVGSSHPYDENMRGEKAWDFWGAERLGWAGFVQPMSLASPGAATASRPNR